MKKFKIKPKSKQLDSAKQTTDQVSKSPIQKVASDVKTKTTVVKKFKFSKKTKQEKAEAAAKKADADRIALEKKNTIIKCNRTKIK